MLVTLKDILKPAMGANFAIPAFNVSSIGLLRAVLEACEEKNSPVIIEIHPDELSFTTNSFSAMVLDSINKTKLPVCLHLDHGSTYEQVINAISAGFSSVMIDASTISFENNIALTKKVVETAHAIGISVEAELGTIGSTGSNFEKETDGIIYTNPDDVKIFVEETSIDALAVAIGTAHGLYPQNRKPKLRTDLLPKIRENAGIPLVLHGGSDNPESEIKEAINLGICKVNISSDIKSAFYIKCREVLRDNNIREPNAIYPACIDAAKQVVHKKIALFGSENKSELYK